MQTKPRRTTARPVFVVHDYIINHIRGFCNSYCENRKKIFRLRVTRGHRGTSHSFLFYLSGENAMNNAVSWIFWFVTAIRLLIYLIMRITIEFKFILSQPTQKFLTIQSDLLTVGNFCAILYTVVYCYIHKLISCFNPRYRKSA